MNRTPVHDFDNALASSYGDVGLRKGLNRFFKTDRTVTRRHSALVDRTCDVMTWAIQRGREQYAERPARLMAVISASTEVENAAAIWGDHGRDWIALSIGLMEQMRRESETMASVYADAFPDVLSSSLGRRLQDQAPLSGGFSSAFQSFLYFSAISFLTGHEIGHHLCGHDGFFTSGAHAEAVTGDDAPPEMDGDRTMRHALEIQADQAGELIARFATTALLMQLVGETTLTAEERQTQQLILAVLLSCGAMMAATFLVPREIDWVVTSTSTHPPSVVRNVALSASLSQAIKSSFPLVSDKALRHIRRTCLTMVAGATIEPGTQLDIEYQERLAVEGDIAALRATGIRKALFDPAFSTYNRALAAAVVQGKSVLRPRTRA